MNADFSLRIIFNKDAPVYCKVAVSGHIDASMRGNFFSLFYFCSSSTYLYTAIRKVGEKKNNNYSINMNLMCSIIST